MTFEFIRQKYGNIDPKRGKRVRWTARKDEEGTITGSNAQYLTIRFDKDKGRRRPSTVHVYDLDYQQIDKSWIDGRMLLAEHNAAWDRMLELLKNGTQA